MSIETIDGQEVLRLHPGVYRGRLSRRAGWRMLPHGVNCARPGWFGNPYRVGVHGDAQACVDRYGHALWEMRFRDAYLAPLVEVHRQHQRIILYCWCRLDQPCHCTPLGDALAEELQRAGVAP